MLVLGIIKLVNFLFLVKLTGTDVIILIDDLLNLVLVLVFDFLFLGTAIS